MLQQIIVAKPYLAWYVKDKEKLSEASALEHILSYGDWEDVLSAKEMIGVAKMKELFEVLISKKRVNLRPRTVNYFRNYFAKYA